MRNLLNIIWKYQFFILFLFFQSLCFILLFQYNKFHKAAVLNYTAEISGSTYLLLNNITSYLQLKEINDALLAENNRLKNQSKANSYYSVHPDRMYFNDSLYQLQYQYLGAYVVNNSTHKLNNFITLKKGKAQGLQPEMGIVTPNGVAGIIKDVSENFAVAISMLHTDIRLSVKLKNTQYFGQVTWPGNHPNRFNLEDIPNHVNIQPGDTIVTSGSSAIFPPNIPVGTIVEINKPEGEVFYQIVIEPTQPLQSLNYVYVIENLLKTEQQTLEKEVQENAN